MSHGMPQRIRPKVDRIRRDIELLATMTDSGATGYTRISFSEEDRRARAYIRESMVTEAGLDVYVDAAGNMIGRCEGEADLPCIMVGSHLDTVPGGGRFDGIAGIQRGRVDITGRMDHSGTTPMNERKDALTAASEIILSLEEICRRMQGVVGTTGTLEIYPGAANVVPSQAVLGMEVRCLHQDKLEAAVAQFRASGERIGSDRGVDVKLDVRPSSNPVQFHSTIVAALAEACRKSNIPYLELPSGAGHDASHLSEIVPTGMLFIPCKEGRSHCSEEWCEFDHIGLGAQALANMILAADKASSVV